jgi:hypothetical protein
VAAGEGDASVLGSFVEEEATPSGAAVVVMFSSVLIRASRTMPSLPAPQREGAHHIASARAARATIA